MVQFTQRIPCDIYRIGVGRNADWLNIWGLIIVVLMLIPNILYALKAKESTNKCKNKMMNIIEQIGRYVSFF